MNGGLNVNDLCIYVLFIQLLQSFKINNLESTNI